MLYTNEELSKLHMVWNYKPVVVRHPKVGGEDVSACDPKVIPSYKVGVIFNTRFEGNKLKAEAWIDVERLREVEPRILSNIEQGRVTEVSTGLFSEFKESEGTWRGERYVAVVTNIRPDHLALLIDEKGACSVADGAGLLRNSDTPPASEGIDMERDKAVEALIANKATPWEESDRETLAKVDQILFEKIVANVTPKAADPAPKPKAKGSLDSRSFEHAAKNGAIPGGAGTAIGAWAIYKELKAEGLTPSPQTVWDVFVGLPPMIQAVVGACLGIGVVIAFLTLADRYGREYH